MTDGADNSVSLQPLARIHGSYERAWAAGWIVAILTREGVPVTPEVKEHIWTGLISLASAPIEERTITGFAILLQSNDIKQGTALLRQSRDGRARNDGHSRQRPFRDDLAGRLTPSAARTARCPQAGRFSPIEALNRL